MEQTMKKLDDSQVEAFDTEYVHDYRWELIKNHIDQDFPNGDFNFLDVGGGNGTFTDRLLKQYPKATATVLDSSELLLSRNLPNPRKTCICESVENLSYLEGKYDLISVNWLLHHLVGESYQQTRRNQLITLKTISTLLTSRGRVSVFENMYEGWLLRNLPGQLIYYFTSLKSIARFTRTMGANTAGVGVCFLSKNQWLSTIREAGIEVRNYTEPDNWVWQISPLWRIFLHVRDRYVGHFWLSSPNQ
jgi:hypothetical protein